MVFGWLSSGPKPARPLSKEPESQDAPTLAQVGAFNVEL